MFLFYDNYALVILVLLRVPLRERSDQYFANGNLFYENYALVILVLLRVPLREDQINISQKIIFFMKIML